MTFSNELTAEQTERLAILAEECAEVIQVVGKILRHGYRSHNPHDRNAVMNRGLLATELGHVDFICSLMVKKGDFDPAVAAQSSRLKAEKITAYLHHQDLQV